VSKSGFILGEQRSRRRRMDKKLSDVEATAVERAPALDLYEPLLIDKENALGANGNGNIETNNATSNHLALFGTKVSPIESLDYE
jgi:hypothetical protein